MKRKCGIALLLMTGLLLLLTACHAAQPMEITVQNPPDGAQFTVLLRAEAGDGMTPAEHTSETNEREPTALEQEAEADGWYRAERLADSAYTEWENSCIRLYYHGSSSKSQLLEFCGRAGSIRIAELDEQGGMCSISEEIDIRFENKMYVPYHLDFDYESGSITVTKGVYRKWNGKTMESWWLEAVFAAQAAGILLLTGGCLCTLIRDIRRRLRVQWILFACMSVPFVLTTALYLLLRLSPDFTWDTSLTSGDVVLLICCNFVWLISLTALTIETAVLQKKGFQYESHRPV